jgi:hypothetical protein
MHPEIRRFIEGFENEAEQTGKYTRTIDISREFDILHRRALNWISRFVGDGTFTPIRPNRRVIGYQLVGFPA